MYGITREFCENLNAATRSPDDVVGDIMLAVQDTMPERREASLEFSFRCGAVILNNGNKVVAIMLANVARSAYFTEAWHQMEQLPDVLEERTSEQSPLLTGRSGTVAINAGVDAPNAPNVYRWVHITGGEAALLIYRGGIKLYSPLSMLATKIAFGMIFAITVDLFSKWGAEHPTAPPLAWIAMAGILQPSISLLVDRLTKNVSPSIEWDWRTRVKTGVMLGLLLCTVLTGVQTLGPHLPATPVFSSQSNWNALFTGLTAAGVFDVAFTFLQFFKNEMMLGKDPRTLLMFTCQQLVAPLAFPPLMLLNTKIGELAGATPAETHDIQDPRHFWPGAGFTMIALPILFILIQLLLGKLAFAIT